MLNKINQLHEIERRLTLKMKIAVKQPVSKTQTLSSKEHSFVFKNMVLLKCNDGYYTSEKQRELSK